ncbi:L-aspartate oxidase [Salsuginibacillus halophilus]|uniref:L-aspartate oxidase n=1 Tax=Salsuginibacillus halophilus TaxID=517424 RepID=A0A2P8HFY4_9BACI|nr:FAD-dependent oxidoreductase [Salsuginibacillus halophilus]PSL45131.1 L-aspartate oxidase [Salsuginibacillus halophilus]
MKAKWTDCIIIGAGLAGLAAAHQLSTHMEVTLISKTHIGKGNSVLAQGGIAAALHKEDYAKQHAADTLNAGGYHHNQKRVEDMTASSGAVIRWLEQLGVSFTKFPDGTFCLSKEGAHQYPRIAHTSKDGTGSSIMQVLTANLPETVICKEGETAFQIHTQGRHCTGVSTVSTYGEVHTYSASAVVLATGGSGQLYTWTSNSDEATGEGYMLAYDAGAELCDLEFVQFHPTIASGAGCKGMLLTEALRGDGAQLVDGEGELLISPLMGGSLAGRDVTARAVEVADQQGKSPALDISEVKDLVGRYPNIYKKLTKDGAALKQTPIPVRAGAHYMMGGVVVDEAMETSVAGLFAIGETAYTGVHGANRLASNSLLEAVAFIPTLVTRVCEVVNNDKSKQAAIQTYDLPMDSPLSATVIGRFMQCYAGPLRSRQKLELLSTRLTAPSEERKKVRPARKEIEAAFQYRLARLMCESMQARKSSLGAHALQGDVEDRDNSYWLVHTRGEKLTAEHKPPIARRLANEYV